MKYLVKDGDKTLEIEEVEDEVVTPAPAEEPAPTETHDDGAPVALSEEEITALKSLASVADKLVALVKENEPAEKTVDEEIDEKEEVIDTCGEEEMPKHDSKKSFGSIEKKTTKPTHDSDEDRDERIAQAWANRSIKGE